MSSPHQLHPAKTPATQPRDQPNGTKLRELPAGKRQREPTRTPKNADASNGPGTQHQVLDQSRSYAPNRPPQHAAIRQASQPGSQASYYYYYYYYYYCYYCYYCNYCYCYY